MAKCRVCLMPVHRYSPDHSEHGPSGRANLMGCVNALKRGIAELQAERDEALERHDQTCAEGYLAGLRERKRLRDGIRRYLACDGSDGRFDALELADVRDELMVLLDDQENTDG